MKFAPVMPGHMYRMLDWGGYHLLQAHTIKDLPDVMQWVRELAYPHSHHHVILDNGLIELGEADVDSLTAAAQAIRPHEIVCPDVAFDADATCELFQEHAPNLSMFCESIMAVPQGHSIYEWCGCVDRLAHYASELSVSIVFGISRLINTWMPAEPLGVSPRTRALHWLDAYMGRNGFWHNVHLLGIDAELYKVSDECRYSIVRGVDSTLPYAMACHGQLIGANTRKVEMEEHHWHETPDDTIIRLAEVNIAHTRHLLGESR